MELAELVEEMKLFTYNQEKNLQIVKTKDFKFTEN